MNKSSAFVFIDTYPVIVQYECHFFVFSLPAQKAPRKLIGYFSVVVAVIVCHRKHFQTTSPLTPNRAQISSVASLGWGIESLYFFMKIDTFVGLLCQLQFPYTYNGKVFTAQQLQIL